MPCTSYELKYSGKTKVNIRPQFWVRDLLADSFLNHYLTVQYLAARRRIQIFPIRDVGIFVHKPELFCYTTFNKSKSPNSECNRSCLILYFQSLENVFWFFCDVTKECSAAFSAPSACDCAVIVSWCSCGNAVASISNFPAIPDLSDDAPGSLTWLTWTMGLTYATDSPALQSVCSLSLW